GFNGSRYLLNSTSVTWTAAEAAAVALGGHLVTVNNATENDWLRRTFSEVGSFWLGLNDVAVEGTHVWTSGQPVTYTNWAPGEPNTPSFDAVFFQTSTGQWFDDSVSGGNLTLTEIPDASITTELGAGPLAGYRLDIELTDPTPPRVSQLTLP